MSINQLDERRRLLSPEKRKLLAARLGNAAAAGTRSQRIPRISHHSEARLSFAQERMWFLYQLDPFSPVYHRPSNLRLRGPLNVRALERAWNAIVERHEVLGTCFSSRDGRPEQRMSEIQPWLLEQVDLSGLPPDQREFEARRLAVAEGCRPFNLERGPVVRARLVRLGEHDHVLLRTFHHIVFDGWSDDIFNRELATSYGSFAAGAATSVPELPLQYADFAAWQRGRLQGAMMEAEVAHWRKQLEGAPALLELPTGRPRPNVRTSRGARLTLVLEKPLAQKLRALGQLEGSTLFMTVLAGFETLMGRYSGQDDLVVGCPSQVEPTQTWKVSSACSSIPCRSGPTFPARPLSVNCWRECAKRH